MLATARIATAAESATALEDGGRPWRPEASGTRKGRLQGPTKTRGTLARTTQTGEKPPPPQPGGTNNDGVDGEDKNKKTVARK